MKDEEIFFLALQRNEIQKVREFVETGRVVVNIVYPSLGYTPLHYAASKSDVSLVEMLLGLGADIDARSNSKMTPLHLAAEEGSWPVIKYLLENGANYNLRDKRDHTAFQVLKLLGYTQLLPPMQKLIQEIERQKRKEQLNIFNKCVNFFSRG